MTHVLRCRVTAHLNRDIAYDGTAKDFQLALTEHENAIAALKATGAEIILADAKPVNIRKTAPEPTEALLPPRQHMFSDTDAGPRHRK